MKNIISTFTGQSFNVLTPDPLTVKIEDIAHALSLYVVQTVISTVFIPLQNIP